MPEKPLFGKFKIIDCLKKDDGLAVYIADHVFLDKRIIVKTLNTRIIGDSVILQRFKREARLLARIEHPNIIAVYDFGMHDEYFYISFEYFKSKNLREALQNNSWSDYDKVKIIQQIILGLIETHRHNIIHRDLKPENILINENGIVKIADFGLAQVSGDENLTAREAVVGTPAYMSPEQVQGLNADARSDLFSLGLIIYELFLGLNPFVGKDAGQTLNNILKCRTPQIKEQSSCPDFIQQIIKDLIRKSPNDRVQSAHALLDYFPGDFKVHPPAKTAVRSRRIKPLLIPLIIIALFLLFENIYFQLPPQTENEIVNNTDSVVTDSLQEQPISTEIVAERDIPAENKIEKTPQQVTPEPTIENNNIEAAPVFGYLDIFCSPWAEILIDSQKVDTTPLKDPIKLQTGSYQIALLHPDYPAYNDNINIIENDTLRVNVNLDTLAAFLQCNVYPWGDIYLNNSFKGQTPLNNPIILIPGDYRLEVRNPKHKTYAESINVVKGDTLTLTVNLDSLNNE